MLTQESVPGPKCKLIISSFLTLLHSLDFLKCTKDAISIGLLLQMMGGWDMWGVVNLYLGCGRGDSGWVFSDNFFSCAFVFCSLTFSLPLFR